MRKNSIVIAICLALTVTCPVWAVSIDEARALESQGQRAAALEMVQEVLDSDGSAEEMAAALDLRGTIAVDEGDLQLAYRSWARLVSDYPDLSDGLGAPTKLTLVTSLMEARGISPSDAPRAASAPKATENEAPPVPASEPAAPKADSPPPAATSAPVPAPASVPAATEPVATSQSEPKPAVTSGTVLVAVSGKPYDAAVLTGERVVAYLKEQGVDAVSATEGIPVVRDAKALVPVMVQRARDEGAASALLVHATYPGRQKIESECYSPDGAQFWKIKVTGGTGWTGRDWSQSGLNEELLERFNKKLSGKIDGPGIPVSSN